MPIPPFQSLAYLGGSILLGVAGQMCFKQAVGGGIGLLEALRGPWLLTGLMLYGISTILYLLALRQLPLSLAVPSLAIGYVLTASLAIAWMGERLSLLQMAGMAVTIAGVIMLHWKAHA